MLYEKNISLRLINYNLLIKTLLEFCEVNFAVRTFAQNSNFKIFKDKNKTKTTKQKSP